MMPELGATEVLLAPRAASLSSRELYELRGHRAGYALSDYISLTSVAGVVQQVGEAVTRFKRNDRVCTLILPRWQEGPLSAAAACHAVVAPHGDFGPAPCGAIRLDQLGLVAAPRHLPDLEACTLPLSALVAWHAVMELVPLHADDTVVVQTAGGVAAFAIQLAVAMGARVIVVSRSSVKLRQALRLGAVAGINSTVTPDWERQVLYQTGGQGAQLVLDMGLSDSLRRAARACAYDATIALVGTLQETVNPLDIQVVARKNLRLRGVEVGSRCMFERMNRYLERHRIHPVLDAVYTPAQFDEAIARLDDCPFGKVVLRLAPA